MHVAFVQADTTHRRDTALARRMRRTGELLADRGHDVTVCCLRWWDGESRLFEQNGISYRTVTDPETAGWFGSRLPVELRDVRPDVIHAAGSEPGHVLAARFGGTMSRTPVVSDWYGEGASGDGWTDRAAVRTPDAVLVPSEHVRTRVRELCENVGDVRIVPESIDTELIRETEPNGDVDLVYSRRLDEDANVESFLLALAELRDRGWRATVVGDGPERPRYERQARDLRIEDRVSFVGDRPLSERIARFKHAHVFVQTAERCSFAAELLRALACGCVGVVEYQVDSSAHELVERCDRGVRTTGDGEVVEAIASAASLPRRDYNPAFERFDHREVLETYLDCYRDVLDARGQL